MFSDAPPWQMQIFLDRVHDSRDCSRCFTAHLIIISDVIQGSRKALGEIISLSSQEKHRAGSFIQRNPSDTQEYTATTSCDERRLVSVLHLQKGRLASISMFVSERFDPE